MGNDKAKSAALAPCSRQPKRPLDAAPCSAWLPIDSAPQDGTRILVPMRGRVTIARWNDQKYHKKPNPFWECVDPFGILSDRENQPVFWMHLPSLPNAVITDPHRGRVSPTEKGNEP